MNSFKSKTLSCTGVLVAGASIALALAAAQAQTIILRGDQPEAVQAEWPGRVSIEYVAPTKPEFQQLYDRLRDRRALENIQDILSPFRFSEQLTIKSAECGAVNSYYQRINLKPTVTICYEFLKQMLDSLPNETTPAGVTPDDATVGQFLWVTLHEVGHATFDMFGVPIFGREEDAADNFATYIMLQFWQGPGAAIDWWRGVGLEGVFGGLQEESRRADAARSLLKRSWSATRALFQSFVPGVRRQQSGVRRCRELLATDANPKLFV